jgi:tetratricopeptide (TPR) repeat protein
MKKTADCFNIATVALCVMLVSSFVQADTPQADAANEALLEKQRRKTAVTLNHCRAAFHRITQAPSKRVLFEEREKILNNLDLNGIADEEVIKLYAAVLSEISEVQIVEKEQVVIQDKYKRLVTHQISSNAFEFGLSLAGGQYLNAVRTGARSWWDFRSTRWNRDLDTWRVEKDRMKAVVGKSSLFLDTFWKLTNKRQIPDRWLIRNTDLDKLEQTVLEPDLQVRLRVLKRMEPFMECYPPYWYYTARTQQATGRLTEAADTYRKLAKLGDGQFRKDEMLAAGLANLAAIEQHQRHPDAVKTAQQALRYSIDAWEVNLLCAQVLKNHIRYDEAEDAILRNLDVDLEREQSMTQLVSLYVESGNKQKLTKRLADPAAVRLVAMPVLLQAAALMGTRQLPQAALAQLGTSLYGYPSVRFGRNGMVLLASPSWKLENARLTLNVGNRTFSQPEMNRTKHHVQLSFRQSAGIANMVNRNSGRSSMTLSIKYPQMQEIRLQLSQAVSSNGSQRPRVASPRRFNEFSVSLFSKPRVAAFRLSSIEMGQTSLAFVPSDRQRGVAGVEVLRAPRNRNTWGLTSFDPSHPSENVLTMPVIPVSVTSQKGPVITPTYVLSEGTDEEFLSDEIDGVSILEVLIEKSLSLKDQKTNQESNSESAPPAPPTSETINLPQPPSAD